MFLNNSGKREKNVEKKKKLAKKRTVNLRMVLIKSYEIETLQLERLKNKYIMPLEFRSFPEFQSIPCLVKIEINQSLLKIKVDNYLRRSLPISKQDIKFAHFY